MGVSLNNKQKTIRLSPDRQILKKYRPSKKERCLIFLCKYKTDKAKPLGLKMTSRSHQAIVDISANQKLRYMACHQEKKMNLSYTRKTRSPLPCSFHQGL